MRMATYSKVAAVAVLVLSSAITKAEAAGVAAPPPALQAVVRCRGLADTQARLACYDQAVDALSQSQASGQVVVMDRAQIETVRRQAFGFHLPAIDILPRVKTEEGTSRLTVILTGAHVDAEGRWVMTTDEGAIWRQSDSSPLQDDPHAGSRMIVSKGLLGSFFCKIDGQSAIRCVRSR
jgi:hypothetical protein